MPPRIKKKKYPEEQLIRLIREKHPNGAAALYDMYSASLLGVIARVIPDASHSEDVLQETFIRIWQSFDQYDAAKGRLFTWMINIARRLAIDLVRSRNYKKELQTGDLTGCEELAFHQDALYDQADRNGIRQASALLGETERTVVDLIYFKGYTHVEAAETLKLPLGTVKTRLVRAVKRLRAYYTQDYLLLAS